MPAHITHTYIFRFSKLGCVWENSQFKKKIKPNKKEANRLKQSINPKRDASNIYLIVTVHHNCGWKD